MPCSKNRIAPLIVVANARLGLITSSPPRVFEATGLPRGALSAAEGPPTFIVPLTAVLKNTGRENDLYTSQERSDSCL